MDTTIGKKKPKHKEWGIRIRTKIHQGLIFNVLVYIDIRWSWDKENYFRDNSMVHFIIKQIGKYTVKGCLSLRKIKIVIQAKSS